jgi:hypothetical protein
MLMIAAYSCVQLLRKNGERISENKHEQGVTPTLEVVKHISRNQGIYIEKEKISIIYHNDVKSMSIALTVMNSTTV